MFKLQKGHWLKLLKWPKEFFKQFHTVVTDEAHGAKAKTITTILGHTFQNAYSRFGVSGTFPEDDTCEILTIQSVLGPKITEVSANELKEKGIITPMDVKVVIMNHEDLEFDGRMTEIRRGGNGKDAFDLEKDYIHQSDKRLEFIKKIVDKCDSNTLLLFHTIEYGQKIFNKLKNELPNKERLKWFTMDLNARYKVYDEFYMLAGGQYLYQTLIEKTYIGGFESGEQVVKDSNFGANIGAGYIYHLLSNVNIFAEIKYTLLANESVPVDSSSYKQARIGMVFDL